MKIIISESAATAKELEVQLKVLLKQRTVNESQIRKLQTANNSLQTKINALSARVEKAKAREGTVVEKKGSSAKPAKKMDVLTPAEMKKTPFSKSGMQGKEWFAAINGKSKALATTEGYWRDKYNTQMSGLPFPVIMPVAGYNKTAFMAALTAAEKRARQVGQKGFSPNRWTGEPNGSGEFELDKWRWPHGIHTYLSAGVPPSAAFYKFITGKENKNLPTYGR